MEELLEGDCLDKLNLIKSMSVDSVITDPPAGISFMNKSWDSDKGGRDEWVKWMSSVMRECLRVLKPGGHALIWAIPRTSHWTATAVEDAGFEVRDVVTHLFGSGFPKSLDISKAIDKEAGAKREILGISENSRDRSTHLVHAMNDIPNKPIELTAPSTPDAIKWQGFGTALKPAAEFWILARKPLSEKTVAKNVLKHGTGGLNIDASRIAATSEKDLKDIRSERVSTSKGQFAGLTTDDKLDRSDRSHVTGRFPANLVLSGDAVDMLDEQSVANGIHSAGKARPRQQHFGDFGIGEHGERVRMADHRFDDKKTGASRFFYCAKVSPSERNAGLEGMPDRDGGCLDGNIDKMNARKIGARPDLPPASVKNNHPTVKPQKLMQYLIKLITPPGGTVLDPFMGSGSTGLACKTLGFHFIGIEKETEYFKIAEKRMEGVNDRT